MHTTKEIKGNNAFIIHTTSTISSYNILYYIDYIDNDKDSQLGK